MTAWFAIALLGCGSNLRPELVRLIELPPPAQVTADEDMTMHMYLTLSHGRTIDGYCKTTKGTMFEPTRAVARHGQPPHMVLDKDLKTMGIVYPDKVQLSPAELRGGSAQTIEVAAGGTLHQYGPHPYKDGACLYMTPDLRFVSIACQGDPKRQAASTTYLVECDGRTWWTTWLVPVE